MNYITLEIRKKTASWALVSLGILGFIPNFRIKTAESLNPETRERTIFVRGKFPGDPSSLRAIPSVVDIHDGNGIRVLLDRAHSSVSFLVI